MKTPFTVEQFLAVMGQYNQAVWPMQVIMYFLAVAALVMIFIKFKDADKILFGILSFFWLWMGIAYHLAFFTSINKAAFAFGGLFIIQGILFMLQATRKDTPGMSFRINYFSATGILFIIYGLIIYPLLGPALGHSYPNAPTFGLPCPTTIFTFGILLLIHSRFPNYLLIIPLTWSIIGFLAAVNFGIFEDTGLLVAGIGGSVLLFIRNRSLMREIAVGDPVG
jgi:hypothetical protein